MRIRIMGSIVHPVEKPNQYFGMLEMYTDEPPLFIPFDFTVLDNRELYPHILFFDENLNLFLDADGRVVPEDLGLGPDQLNMYQILTTSVFFGIFNILGRQPHGFNYTPLVHNKSRRRGNKKSKPQRNMVVPFIFEIINLDEKQIKILTKLGSKFDDMSS